MNDSPEKLRAMKSNPELESIFAKLDDRRHVVQRAMALSESQTGPGVEKFSEHLKLLAEQENLERTERALIRQALLDMRDDNRRAKPAQLLVIVATVCTAAAVIVQAYDLPPIVTALVVGLPLAVTAGHAYRKYVCG